jgi:hypothetical protein
MVVRFRSCLRPRARGYGRDAADIAREDPIHLDLI